MKLSLLVLAAVVAAPAFAADKPLFLSGGSKAEDSLRVFIDRDPKLKARLDDAARREEAALAAVRDPDLRDSVGAPPDRAALIASLPGMKAPPPPTCLVLSDCAEPAFTAEVSDAALVPETLRRMVRPWMLLQAARGSEIELAPAEGGDAALKVGLKGLSAAPLTIDVAPGPSGGFKVSFERPLEIASLYARERDAALKSAR
jgi:hypothetical protein